MKSIQQVMDGERGWGGGAEGSKPLVLTVLLLSPNTAVPKGTASSEGLSHDAAVTARSIRKIQLPIATQLKSDGARIQMQLCLGSKAIFFPPKLQRLPQKDDMAEPACCLPNVF